ncbi:MULTISPECIES: hypothetical protein [Herbaspirillum]|uniref:hypothetical protein n=1 Tax=Herbaspirillum TaxID=963 RepID=UPI001F5A04E8|nr:MULTISPECIES: hypothetical protein [Herbaspirillum]
MAKVTMLLSCAWEAAKYSTEALFWISADDGRKPSLFFFIVANPLLLCDPCGTPALPARYSP